VRRVFVDSSAFFALIAREVRLRTHATMIFHRATSERWTLLTTNAVVIETHALLLNRMRQGRRKALQFLDALAHSKVEVERCTEQDERAAIALLRAHTDKSYSLCDALSFVVMERLGVEEAISYDADFRSYGRFLIH